MNGLFWIICHGQTTIAYRTIQLQTFFCHAESAVVQRYWLHYRRATLIFLDIEKKTSVQQLLNYIGRRRITDYMWNTNFTNEPGGWGHKYSISTIQFSYVINADLTEKCQQLLLVKSCFKAIAQTITIFGSYA